jgi:hypothetical protein
LRHLQLLQQLIPRTSVKVPQSGFHLEQFLYVNLEANLMAVRLGRSSGGLAREQWAQVFEC